jgi:uncharacterized protein YhfF
MKERGIIFSGPMVRAILNERKSMTRRVIRPQAWNYSNDVLQPRVIYARENENDFGDPSRPISCPYGQPGDRLWVRETWFPWPTEAKAIYRATDESIIGAPKSGWKPSIFMPRWASRILLEITDVKVERLTNISVDDAKAEGVSPLGMEGDGRRWRASFRELWDSINKKHPWESNPWVWVISFKRIKP